MPCDMRVTVMIFPHLLSVIGPCLLLGKGSSRLACGPGLDFGLFLYGLPDKHGLLYFKRSVNQERRM